MTNPMDQVFSRLDSAGISRSYMRSAVLPSWWDKNLADSPSGFAETLMIIGSRLGVAPSELQGDGPLRIEPSKNQRFYLSASTSPHDVVVAQRLAFQVARIVARGVTSPVKPLPTSASELRSSILNESKAVDFDSILAFCERSGIAVLHARNLPANRKMTALVGYSEDRPIIILCHRKKASWLLFHLAHEIGHLASGHVQPGGLLAEEGIDDASTNVDEKQANEYAFDLLAGTPRIRLPKEIGWKAPVLAMRARSLGQMHGVDPGHLALVYSKTINRIALGSAALNWLDSQDDAVGRIHRSLRRSVDPSRLSEDEIEFVNRVMETELDP